MSAKCQEQTFAKWNRLSAVSPKSDQVWISQALDLASKVSKPSAETHDGKYHI